MVLEKTVKMSTHTYDRLVKIGKYHENMDMIISRCIDAYDKLYGSVKVKTHKKDLQKCLTMR